MAAQPAIRQAGQSGGSKRKSSMTSPFKAPASTFKRPKTDSDGDDSPDGRSTPVLGRFSEAGPSTPSKMTFKSGDSASQVVLGALTPGKASSPAISVGVDSKSEIMKDGGFTPVMSKEEKRKEKKRLKEAKARQVNVPQFLFNTDGFRFGKSIGIAHIRDLLLHIVTENAAPNWIVVQNRPYISHTCCVFVPGIQPEHLGLQAPTSNMPFPTHTSSSTAKSQLPIIPKLFSHACPTRAPGDQRRLHSALNALLQAPLTEGEKKRREQAKARKAALKNEQPMSNNDPRQYLLTPHEMLDNDYPIPDYVKLGDEIFIPGRSTPPPPAQSIEKDAAKMDWRTTWNLNPDKKGHGPGWVETPLAEPQQDGATWRVLATDCEMCKAGEEQILARVSVIDCATGQKVYDELCVPGKPITDYVTAYSGMTKEKLDKATLSLADIQSQLLQPNLITSNTILLGHSLECDLTALKIRHPLCIDTALLFKHPRGAPYKSSLKHLAKQWLGRDIQNHGIGGHDSEEDARACVDLLQLKLVHGPDFAANVTETESIFERMSRHAFNSERPGKTSALCDYGNPAQWHGSVKTVIGCRSDDEVVNGMIENVQNHDFVFGRMLELATALGWSKTPLPSVDDTMDDAEAPVPVNADDQLSQGLRSLNDRLKRLHDSLPPATALIVLTGHSDPRPAVELLARKTNFERLYKTLGADGLQNLSPAEKWMSSDDRELEAAAMKAREGMAFFCVK